MMKWFAVMSVLFLAELSLASPDSLSAVPPLQLLKAHSVAGPQDFQPSGLAVCEGHLVTVSDRHDDRVFELVVTDAETKIADFYQLETVPDHDTPYLSWRHWLETIFIRWKTGRIYDWEGVSCDPEGGLYLLSESFADVLAIKATQPSQWLYPGFFDYGHRLGAFQENNAVVEGIAWSEVGHYVAAERQPRGLFHLTKDQSEGQVFSDKDDIAGLFWQQQKLFVLERNARKLCRYDGVSLAKELCWSYQHIELDQQYHYQNTRFGIAEGIAVWRDSLWIIVDNNSKARLVADQDVRPQLWQFTLPHDWLKPATN